MSKWVLVIAMVSQPAWAQTPDGETVVKRQDSVPGERADAPATARQAERGPVAEEAVEELTLQEVQPADEAADYYSASYAQIDRAFNLLTARPTRKGNFEAVIAHRTNETFRKNTFRDWFGFDAGGLKIGLGLRYGLFDHVDVGAYRLNGVAEIFDTYEFDARWQVMDQAHDGVDLALRGGVTWFYQPAAQDGSGFFGQLLVDRVFANRLMLGTGLMFHSDSSGEIKRRCTETVCPDKDYSMAVMALGEYRLSEWWAWAYEVSATVAGYGTDLRVAHTTGPKVITNRHTFAFVITNTRYMSADGVVANSKRGIRNLVIGFNITREI